jgi:hypothetical protein
MDVNQKYCQSCHLISRNGFIITKIMSSQINMLLMYRVTDEKPLTLYLTYPLSDLNK